MTICPAKEIIKRQQQQQRSCFEIGADVIDVKEWCVKQYNRCGADHEMK